MIYTFRDMRERQLLESQLQQAQKMEAVGTLASGIAHDFNNLLQAVSGYVQLLLTRLERDLESRRYILGIEHAVTRGSDLVHRMLTFSRKVKTELMVVDLAQEIRHTVGILERTIPKMIQIKTHLDDGLHKINGDPNQLQQVLMNLGTNAKDAMPKGGRLLIEARNVNLDEEYCQTQPDLSPGDYVLLRVADNGEGMDGETVQHIFEPFFTTKAVGEGTGLGLSTIYGIIKAHGGHIACRSRIGRGTTFNIFFPAIKDLGPVEPHVPPVLLSLGRGNETILLVDDEAAIRETVREVLTNFGYRTIEAASGEEALEIFQKDGPLIDLIILDLGMPGIGGHSCLKELLKIDPRVKVIVASGYSEESQIQEVLKEGAVRFIAKPYRLGLLLDHLRQILDS